MTAAGDSIPSLREQVHDALNVTHPDDRVGLLFGRVMVVLIVVSCVGVVVESVEELRRQQQVWLEIVELGTVLAFTFEYLLRLWACTVEPRYRHPILGRLRYAVSGMAVLDLLAILPFYLTAGTGHHLRVLRLFRLFRLLRAFKLVRYSRTLRIFGRVLQGKRQELGLALMVDLVLIAVAAALIYAAEHEAQPETFSNIPVSAWWAVITLTTVGYGDAYPVTAVGRILASAFAVMGIGLMALPAGILASGFMEEAQQMRVSRGLCPSCGRKLTSGEESSEGEESTDPEDEKDDSDARE